MSHTALSARNACGRLPPPLRQCELARIVAVFDGI